MKINLNIGLGTLIFLDTVQIHISLHLEHMEIYAALHFITFLIQY
jgi:hypothetical protein